MEISSKLCAGFHARLWFGLGLPGPQEPELEPVPGVRSSQPPPRIPRQDLQRRNTQTQYHEK